MGARVVIRLAAAVVLVGAALAAVWAYGDRLDGEPGAARAVPTPDAGANVPRVKTVDVFLRPMTDTLVIPGSVKARQEIEVGCQGEGLVTWIGAEEGDRVKAGQPLLRLDVESLEAALAQAQARLNLAQKRYERFAALLEKEIASRDTFDDAEAELALSRAAVRTAEIALKHGVVRSPTDGILDRRYVDAGEFLHRGDPVGRVICIESVYVVAQVPEKDILYIGKGQPAEVVLHNGGTVRYDGTIHFVPMSTESLSRTYPVEIRVANPEGLLRPGMITRVSLVRRQREATIAVPFFTLVEGERGETVFVEKDGVAQERHVELGVIQGGMIEITDGLAEGDRLIVVGQRDLVNGEPVKIDTDLTDVARQLVASGQDLTQLVRVTQP